MYKFSLSNFRGRNNWENILHVNHFEDADRRGAFFDKNNTIFKIFTLGISLKVKKRTQNERVEDHHIKNSSVFFLASANQIPCLHAQPQNIRYTENFYRFTTAQTPFNWSEQDPLAHTNFRVNKRHDQTKEFCYFTIVKCDFQCKNTKNGVGTHSDLNN